MMLAATVCTPQTPRNQPTNPLLPAEKGVLLLQRANARTMSGRECQAALAAPCWGWRPCRQRSIAGKTARRWSVAAWRRRNRVRFSAVAVPYLYYIDLLLSSNHEGSGCQPRRVQQ